ncbi:MAG TPA: NPCBM/NEW2 domain-containing protein [Steroidobacteraceae bacterium]|nr:NPCBM/NEW2 domain-containing protein [Steroidobacteraceae bacterium]
MKSLSNFKLKYLIASFVTLTLSSLVMSSSRADELNPTGKWSIYSGGRANTPPMGWSSWNAFQTEIDETKILGVAQALIDTGLAAKGYTYVNIDDGWWQKRRLSDGRLQVSTKLFPSAVVNGEEASSFRPFTDTVHKMGLKAGIYSDLGRNSCSQAYSPQTPTLPVGSVIEREVGLYGHVDQDIQLFFRDWGFDFIKVDACGVRAFGKSATRVVSGEYRSLDPIIEQGLTNRTNIQAVKQLYGDIGEALKRNNPDNDYVYSICAWGSADVRTWAKTVGNISRTSDDIGPVWSRMLVNLDSVTTRALYAHPGSWNDADMLFVGQGDFNASHLNEARSHFALWAMVNSPLILGYDIRVSPAETLTIVGNEDIIAINQDVAGNQAVLAYNSDDVQIFVKTLESGDKAVAIFNRRLDQANATLTADHLKFATNEDISLTDLWTKQSQIFRKEIKLKLDGHQTLVFKATGTRALPKGIYLSEIPGRVNPAVDGTSLKLPDPFIHLSSQSWNGTRGHGDVPIYSGWGGAQVDATPYGQPLQVNGQRFKAGLGILTNSRVEVRNTDATKFTAAVGVDDSSWNTTQSATFMVYGDGKLLVKSKALRFGQAAQVLTANIKDIKIIELVTRSVSVPNVLPTVTTWGDAALLD